MDVHASWVPKTEEEKDQVRRQMERLLETVHFKNSRRYPALFRFIVEETLEGRGEFLKERLLGVRVFNRPPDYDTADDPIARVTIAEIRKRIAQYYHEEAHESEMRIELMPGRYEPEFYPRKPRASPPTGPLKSSNGVSSTPGPGYRDASRSSGTKDQKSLACGLSMVGRRHSCALPHRRMRFTVAPGAAFCRRSAMESGA